MDLQLSIPDHLRDDFGSPRGLLVSGRLASYIDSGRWSKVVCVGDVVTAYCMEASRKPDLVVLDLKTRRSEAQEGYLTNRLKEEGFEVLRVSNPAGGLTTSAAEILCSALKGSTRSVLIVEGEEDMLALAALQCAPPNSLVVYGVPARGAAMVVTDVNIGREAQTRQLRLRPRPLES